MGKTGPKGALSGEAKTGKPVDYRKDYYTGFFAKTYFTRVMRRIVEYGDLKNERGLILDFGCGVGHLKGLLKPYGVRVVGYDLIPELSDIRDYKSVRPSKIVCNAVFEHIRPSGIRKILDDFEAMNPDSALLVALPTENLFSRMGMWLTNNKHLHDDHVTGYKEVNKIIEERYRVEKRCYLMFRMAQVTKYVRKG